MFFTLENEKNSKTKSWQDNKCCTCSNKSVDELKRAFDVERKEYERKLEKLIKSQLDPLIYNKRSDDLEIAVSKLRAERDEYQYEINSLKKQHNTEVIITAFNIYLVHSVLLRFILLDYKFKKKNGRNEKRRI